MERRDILHFAYLSLVTRGVINNIFLSHAIYATTIVLSVKVELPCQLYSPFEPLFLFKISCQKCITTDFITYFIYHLCRFFWTYGQCGAKGIKSVMPHKTVCFSKPFSEAYGTSLPAFRFIFKRDSFLKPLLRFVKTNL